MPAIVRPERRRLERDVLHEIREALGCEPGLVLWRNAQTGGAIEGRWTRGGLGEGSPDLIGILDGRFVALEVKRPGQRAREAQEAWLALVRARGGFAAVVDGVEAARAAIARARAGGAE
jgi:hypothetical protein